MKIATYVDEGGEVVNVYEKGFVRVYDNASGTWRVVREIPFEVRMEMTLAEVKSVLRDVVAQLDDCRTFLSGEVRGLIYSLLQEENGFRVWKSRGAPEAQLLDQIARQDAELAVQREQEAAERAFAALFSSPSGGCGGGGCGGGGGGKRSGAALQAVQSMTEALGEGHFRINLSDILARYRNANSMDVLIPLLEGSQFRSLEILCDHVPRWFDRKVADLNLTADITHSPRGVKALVFPNS